MPKISELNAITDLLDDDLIAVAHDVNGLPSTRKLTFANLLNNIPSANSTVPGKVYFPDSGESEGYMLTWDDAANAALWQPLAPVYSFTTLNSSNTYSVTKHDAVLFVEPLSVGEDVTVILPITDAVQGKQYFIKNNTGVFNVKVTTETGVSDNSYALEDPLTGSLVLEYNIVGKGNINSWIYDGVDWKHLTSDYVIPTFYTSANTFAQVVIKNASEGTNASTDLVLYNDQGLENQGIGPLTDIGINSSNYSNTQYSIGGPSDGYLFTSGNNLTIGTQTEGTSLIFHAGGTQAENRLLTINSTATYVNNTIVLVDTVPNASPAISSIRSNTSIIIESNGKSLTINSTNGNTTLTGSVNTPSIILGKEAALSGNTSEVTSTTYTYNARLLDKSKSVHYLTTSIAGSNTSYYLPDGNDGQVMYFVPSPGNNSGEIKVWFNSMRAWNANTLVSNVAWYPFKTFRTMATAVYVSGAWAIDNDYYNFN